MKITFSRQTESQDIFTSQLFDQDSFYQKFFKDVANCNQELIIESPFMTVRRSRYALPYFEKAIRRGAKVVINTKHPDEQGDILKNEALISVGLLQKAGVTVLFTGGHHRKLAIVDRTILWEGSLNMLSQADSCEIMRRIHSPIMSQQMINFLGIERHLPKTQISML